VCFSECLCAREKGRESAIETAGEKESERKQDRDRMWEMRISHVFPGETLHMC